MDEVKKNSAETNIAIALLVLSEMAAAAAYREDGKTLNAIAHLASVTHSYWNRIEFIEENGLEAYFNFCKDEKNLFKGE